MREGLPQGTVTFMFTDIEGSTRLLHELGEADYAAALTAHRRVIRAAAATHGGTEVDTQGDAFFLAFPTADGAAHAAAAARDQLAGGPIRVRVGLHTGHPFVTDEGYVGADVHLAARIGAAAHGGQILLSEQTVAAIGSDIAVTSLGEHRLKDIGGSVRIHQLGADPFPPLRTISNSNLPTPVSSFLGRTHDVARIRDRILEGGRLVTLTGPGGTGKTRLSIAVAEGLRDRFTDGVMWVGLATIRDPSIVMPTIARTLGLEGDLAAGIGTKRMLLVLDNMEQVVDAAPYLASLLNRCSELVILVTSRVILRVSGEIQVPIDSLPLDAAIALFLERSGVAPSDDVELLCARLDALPLAIELAAVRARSLGTRFVLDRLAGRLDLLKGGRDLDPRQQSLRATIAWSDDLLEAAGRTAFRRLSLFVGGCALEVAESIIGADVDAIESLVEHSLVRVTDGRLWMLETIRTYAQEGLAAEPNRRAMEDAFTTWALELLESQNRLLRGPAQLGALDRLDVEIDNIRAAFAMVVGRPDVDPDIVRRFPIAARWWLERRGFIAEARAWNASALELEGGDPGLRGWTLFHSAALSFDEATSTAGRTALEEARLLGEQAGDVSLVASALENIGFLTSGESGLAMMREAGRMFRAAGLTDGEVRVMLNLAARALNDGDAAQALQMARDGVRGAVTQGNRHGIGVGTSSEAAALVLLGRDRDAAAAVVAAIRVLDEIGDRFSATFLLGTAALLAAREGLPDLAAWMLAVVLDAYEQVGLGREPVDDRLIAATEAAIGRVGAPNRMTTDDGTAIDSREAIDRWLAQTGLVSTGR